MKLHQVNLTTVLAQFYSLTIYADFIFMFVPSPRLLVQCLGYWLITGLDLRSCWASLVLESSVVWHGGEAPLLWSQTIAIKIPAWPLTVWPWGSQSTFLCFSFLICETRINDSYKRIRLLLGLYIVTLDTLWIVLEQLLAHGKNHISVNYYNHNNCHFSLTQLCSLSFLSNTVLLRLLL